MSDPRRTILAMGGGGFTMEPDNPVLDDLVLELSAAREPRILFLPTASGDPAAQIAAFHERFSARACRPAHLSLFRLHGSAQHRDHHDPCGTACDDDRIPERDPLAMSLGEVSEQEADGQA